MMVAHLHYFPTLYNSDDVSILNCGEAVGDNDGRTPLHGVI